MHWILLDTETSGIHSPIFVLELAAQRMCDWEPEGPPFCRLLNYNQAIPPEASRVNGLTREILERDGDPPLNVYREFADYVGDLPLASYNLAFDFDQVLLPEWERLGLKPIGRRGFCALRLAQRLLDPVPAGNHKLQTLRQFYRLPARGAHTALGDVETVIDLMRQVLRPLAEQRGLMTIEQAQAFALQTWFPPRIAFGKFKGHHYREATRNKEFRKWLEWLATSSNPRSAHMGRWYLKQLQQADLTERADILCEPSGTGIVLYSSPEAVVLKRLIDAARARLVDLEVELTQERYALDTVQAQLFVLLRPVYERRDQLALLVRYRRRYLDTLFQEGEEEAAKTAEQYQEARNESDREYDEAAKVYGNKKQALNNEDRVELQKLWRKLVRLYHPDRYQDDPVKEAVYQYLTSEINRARDQGDIKHLREIAEDPNGFLLKQGKTSLAFDDDDDDVTCLLQLYESLQSQIMEMIESIEALKTGAEHELYLYSLQNTDWLEDTAKVHTEALEKEIADLEHESATLAEEIENLTGEQAL